jgi:hypothetical protein
MLLGDVVENNDSDNDGEEATMPPLQKRYLTITEAERKDSIGMSYNVANRLYDLMCAIVSCACMLHDADIVIVAYAVLFESSCRLSLAQLSWTASAW